MYENEIKMLKRMNSMEKKPANENKRFDLEDEIKDMTAH